VDNIKMDLEGMSVPKEMHCPRKVHSSKSWYLECRMSALHCHS